MECGQELPASQYEEQIEAWKDEVCRQLTVPAKSENEKNNRS
jgi:hypothetical protein